MRVLAAEGIILEPQTAEHAEAMFTVLSDPALYEYENKPPASLEWLHIRFSKLESRCSPDGSEAWLNWVIRLPSFGLIGYVQATVRSDGHAYIAYIVSSRFWGKGFARRAVEAMIADLAESYDVHTLWAVFKEENFRSQRLLERLGFYPVPPDLYAEHSVEPNELLFNRECSLMRF